MAILEMISNLFCYVGNENNPLKKNERISNF